MDSGWIKIHRKLGDWGWYSDNSTRSVFLHIVLFANHKKGNWKGQEVKRGQIITGRKRLAEELGLSERNIRTALVNLQSTNEVTIKTTSRYSIITINNYNLYQPNDQQATSARPAPDHKQECSNEKKEIYTRIIARLNKCSGKSFRSNSKETQSHINARLKDGYKEEDFNRVIDHKCKEWRNNEDMKKYLQPSTLFSPSKFEGYLNASPRVVKTQDVKAYNPNEDV